MPMKPVSNTLFDASKAVASDVTQTNINITPYPTTTGAASWWRQSWIMMRRNFTLYCKRYWQSTIAQVVFAPLVFLFLLWILQQANNRQQLRSRRHPLKYPMTGLPDCQGPEFGQPCINLLYTPDTAAVRQILTLFAEEQKRLGGSTWAFDAPLPSGPPSSVMGMVPVPNGNAIYDYVLQTPNYTNWGVVFDITESPTPNGLGPNYRYQVWMNASQSGNGSEVFGVYPLTFMTMMDAAIMAVATNSPVDISVSLKDWPRIPPSFTYDAIVQSLGTVFFFCAAMVIFINILNTIVSEKEQRLRSAMEMMGLHPSVYWFTYFVTYALETLVASLVTCCFGLAFGFEAFRNTNFAVTLITFFLFGVAMNCFAFFITTCVSKSRVAVLVGIFMFIIGLLFESFVFSNQFVGYVWWEPGTVSPAGWIVLVFLPFFNFGKMFLDITTLATGKPDFQTDTYIPGPGFTWADLYEPIPPEFLPYYGNGMQPAVPPPIYSWYFLLMNIAFYLLLTFYLDNVIPDEFGQKQPPWFFLLPSYWGLDATSRSARIKEGPVGDGAFAPSVTEQAAANDWLNKIKTECTSLGYLDQIPPDQDEDVTIEARNALDPNYSQPLHKGDKDSQVLQPPAVRIVGLRKVYKNSAFKASKNDKIAVNNTNLTMQEGVLLALLGQNGAGKSTTINILSGLTPATSGDALIYNMSVRDQMSFIRSQMGICPQHDILFTDLSAEEHMQLYAGLKGIPESDIAQLTEERLAAVRLWNVKDQRAGTYSGGMKRRLSMVISTVGDPKSKFSIIYEIDDFSHLFGRTDDGFGSSGETLCVVLYRAI